MLDSEKRLTESPYLFHEEEGTELRDSTNVGYAGSLKRSVFTAFDCASFSRPLLTAKNVPRFLALALLPSFIIPVFSRERSPAKKLHPTAYLDGIRGLAAFVVFICHMSYGVFDLAIGFNQGHEEVNRRVLYIPIVRLFYSGPPMVAIFFIISGYVLSYKPLKQMRSGAHDRLLQTLSSYTFRRGLRLFLPCFASTFVVFLLVRLGVYDYTRPMADNHYYMRNLHEHHPLRSGTFMEQFFDWALKSFDFVHVWEWDIFGGSTTYDLHLWTVPVEFRASMALFLSHLALAHLRPAIRISFLFALSYWAMKWDRWEMILFWAGTLLAEFDLIRLGRTASKSTFDFGRPRSVDASSWNTCITDTLRALFWTVNLVVGLYLLSYPDLYANSTPGYIYLSSLVPTYWSQEYRFWQSVGSIITMWTITNNGFMQAVFKTPPIQYLGKLSFALYLVHGMVIHTVGYMIMEYMWGISGTQTWFRFQVGFGMAACCIIAVTIWVADIFWRAVDVPCVNFAKWIDKKCTAGSYSR